MTGKILVRLLVVSALTAVLAVSACDEGSLEQASQVVKEVSDCTPGTLGCTCKERLCAAGLSCSDVQGLELCLPVDNCPNGIFGCPCYADGTCDLDELGESMACVEGVCAKTGCLLGERDCPCISGIMCTEKADVCDNGMCVKDTGQTTKVPTAPKCYTPCKGDNVLGNTLIASCDGEGLMKGCVEDTTCVNGSCLTDEELELSWDQATGCSADAQCPFFQDCVKGHCYSTCETSSDCRMSRECVKKVCRQPCVATSDICGSEEYCQTVDGQSGFCMPLILKRPEMAPDGPLTTLVNGRAVYEVRGGSQGLTDHLNFTVAVPRATFEVANLSTRPIAFTIEATLQKSLNQDGKEVMITNEEGDTPLNWLGIEMWDGEDQLEEWDGGKWKNLGFTIPPEETRQFILTDGDDVDLSRWEGKWAVSADDGTSQELTGTFARSPEGYWAGTMVMFASFGTSGLDEFKAGQKPASDVGNAFLQKWFALKQGDLTLFEFRDILSATSKGTWKDPILQSRCPEEGMPLANHACYPTSIGDGVGHYSNDVNAVPVPDGVIELPMAMMLRLAVPSSPTKWQGIVKTSETLQYPGDPAVNLEFKTSPEACPVGGGTCLAFMKSMNFTSWIGARLEIDADESCPAGLQLKLFPWFVPLFEAGTEYNTSDGLYYKRSCRNWTFPFIGEGQPAGWPQAIKAANASFNGGNPLPTGRTLERKVELIDGALIEQDTIFAIVRETVPSFLDPAGKETFSAYGYIVLKRSGPLDESTEFTAGSAPTGGTDAETPEIACTEELLDTVFPGAGLTSDSFALANADTKRRMGLAMVTGLVPPEAGDVMNAGDVHWYCAQTDMFDKGPNGATKCPEGSQVTWFKFKGAPIAMGPTLACQNNVCDSGEPCAAYRCGPPCAAGDASCTVADVEECGGECGEGEVCLNPCEIGTVCTAATGTGACQQTLKYWAATDKVMLNPACYCTGTGTACTPSGSACSDDRLNLTSGRTFYGVQAVMPLPPATDVQPGDAAPHYFCHETGYFDMGPNGTTPCPSTSKVEFFALKKTDGQVRALSCQTEPGVCQAGEDCATVFKNDDGTVGEALCNPGDVCSAKGNCGDYLAGLKAVPGDTGYAALFGWSCEDPTVVTCLFPDDPNVIDLREGKVFYTPEAEQVVFKALRTEIDEAFRYRTRFQNRQGTQVGFAPEACEVGDVIPYCYDAGAIETVESRIDCAAYIYSNFYNQLVGAGHLDAILELRSFLDFTFSHLEVAVPGLPDPVIKPGFEQLYGELLVMLGDESVTRAFGSRFDLVGQMLAEFPGDKLEPNGLKLGGKPGYELRSLYQGVQYYQLVLDRFFRHGPLIAESLDDDASGPPLLDGFIDAQTAVSYLPRVARAAAKKARAWEAIAELYESLNQVDLSRAVLERASAEAFLESIIVLQVMDAIAYTADPASQAGIRREKELRQLEFAMALNKMRSRYDNLSNADSFLGVPYSFVPIPPMDIVSVNVQATNAFDVALATAFDRVAIAKESEQLALTQKRDFDTDKEVFKTEMFNLIGSYEGQLADLCGWMTGDDGGQYAAIPQNAQLSEATRAMGNPCGLVGNGAIFEATKDLDSVLLDAQAVKQRMASISAKATDMTARVEEQCNRVVALSDMLVSLEGKTTSIETQKDGMEKTVASLDRGMGWATDFRDGVACIAGVATDCPAKVAGNIAWLATTASLGVVAMGLELALPELTRQLGEVEQDKVKVETLTECEAMRIDLKFDLKDLYREMLEVQIEAAQAQIALDKQLGTLRGMHQLVEGTISDYQTSIQLSINVAAAHNDPNIRIIKNEAIIRADKHFKRALREAYRATRVYEYYTSQSYGPWENLKLIRLVSVGENNLEDYLLDLQDAFLEFEYQFGQPDMRLEIISMKSDIVPVLRKNTAMTEEERRLAFHDALADIALRDSRGWIVLPFSTALKRVSPITANHKILYVEGELVGRDLGDALGRIYVRQTGTGTLRQLSGDLDQKTFPAATAVINTIFNGRRGSQNMDFDPALYKNWRLRDRPLVNTGWELIFNNRDEYVNKDIDLDGLQDILLYVYYTDFTTLDTVTE